MNEYSDRVVINRTSDAALVAAVIAAVAGLWSKGKFLTLLQLTLLKRLLYETIKLGEHVKKIEMKIFMAGTTRIFLRLRLKENTARLNANSLRLSFCGFGCGSQVVESYKFFPPRVLNALAERVPLGFGYRRSGSKN